METNTKTKPVKINPIKTLMSSLLLVEARSEDSVANPGNRRNNYITVSVITDNGTPVTGLTSANFKIDAMIVGPGGALVDIVAVNAGRLPGFYHIDVTPIRTETWKAGTYIFAVAVESKNAKGQTFADVLMD